MRRPTALLVSAACCVGCGGEGIELKPARVVRGHVARADPGPVPRELRAFGSREAFLLFPQRRILATVDGGGTWQAWPQRAPRGDHRFLSRTHWLSSRRGRLYESGDGGRSWRFVRPLQPPLRASAFLTAGFGYACARVCVVFDRGTVTRVSLPRSRLCTNEFQVSRGAAFADVRHGLLLCGGQPGAGQQFKQAWSWNGTRWRPLPAPSTSGYVGRIDALGPETYVHHSGRIGDLLTTDGGRTWRTGLVSDAIQGEWVSPRGAWALNRSRGDLLRTDDGGRNWRHVAPAFWPSGDVVFCDLKHGFGGGSYALGSRPDTDLYATSDGGRHWTIRAHFRRDGASPRACFGSVVFVVQNGRLRRSNDGGRRWRAVDTPVGAIVASFLSARTFAGVDLRGGILATHDGGKTWLRAQLDDGSADSVAFASARLGLAVQRHRAEAKSSFTTLLRTTDGGATWHRVPVRVPNVRIVEVRGGHGVLWVIDPRRMFRTSDGGRRWTRIESAGMPFDPRLFSATIGVAAGFRGLYLTHDGGVTWRWVRRGGYS
jgi:photosystem II stability/assembly factor-like uncharacterized protein